MGYAERQRSRAEEPTNPELTGPRDGRPVETKSADEARFSRGGLAHQELKTTSNQTTKRPRARLVSRQVSPLAVTPRSCGRLQIDRLPYDLPQVPRVQATAHEQTHACQAKSVCPTAGHAHGLSVSPWRRRGSARDRHRVCCRGPYQGAAALIQGAMSVCTLRQLRSLLIWRFMATNRSFVSAVQVSC